MGTKHTPGPWRSAMKSEKSWNVGVYTEGGDEVAHVAVKSAFAAPRRDADARLIAAAPDLLAFVREFRDAYYKEDGWIDLKSFAKTACDLIAKTEGK